jgi:hypothetical protein
MAESGERSEQLFRVGFGIADIVSAALVFLGVFQGLPSRYWPVDAAAALVLALFAAAGVGLLLRTAWAPTVAWIASTISLSVGLTLVATLALTASFLSGIYGPVGRGGALILTLVAALALPYLVVLPVAQLVWLGPFQSLRSMAPDAPAPKPATGSAPAS